MTCREQTPNQVYIDVESHEMVDVIDTKTLRAETALDSMPNRPYSEKHGRLSAAATADSL